MKMEKINDLLESLSELTNDSTIPKNIREKIRKVIGHLSEKIELSLRIDKALNKLEEVSDDSNIQSYTRTQIWNIISALEMIK